MSTPPFLVDVGLIKVVFVLNFLYPSELFCQVPMFKCPKMTRWRKNFSRFRFLIIDHNKRISQKIWKNVILANPYPSLPPHCRAKKITITQKARSPYLWQRRGWRSSPCSRGLGPEAGSTRPSICSFWFGLVFAIFVRFCFGVVCLALQEVLAHPAEEKFLGFLQFICLLWNNFVFGHVWMFEIMLQFSF